MPLRICPTCRGMCRITTGGGSVICPTCRGSGGIPLGSPPVDLDQNVPPPSGQSRAAEHVARKLPLLGSLPPRR